jgi:uncharacterized protein (TIGR00725 family)
MRPGDLATSLDLENAYKLGQLIAQEGWVLLTGGRKVGVMDAASKAAKSADGLTIGILPNQDKSGMSEFVDIAIITDMNNARNNINVLSSDVVIACGMGLGTASEIALALKNRKKVILLTKNQESKEFFLNLAPNDVLLAKNAGEAIALIKQILNS